MWEKSVKSGGCKICWTDYSETLLKRTYSKSEENIQFMGKLDVQVLLI